MAQVLKEEIAARLLDAARDAFYKDGFKGATMRAVAEAAGVPVGLVYTYYENKLTLFDKVVSPVRMRLGALVKEERADKKATHLDEVLFRELSDLLHIFTSYRKEFIILVDKSAGTPYENDKQALVEMTARHIKAGLEPRLKDANKDMDDLFYHILANNFTESVCEIARHWKGEAWAKKMLGLVAQQYCYGVYGM